MKLSKTVRRLASSEDGEELRRAARDVGHELPRRRLKILARFRMMVSLLSLDADPFVLGYRAALVDVVAAYEDSCR